MKCHSMQRSFNNFTNQIDHMPLYNRSHAQNKHKNVDDIALSTHKKQVYLEKEIKLDDTLQSVALEFNVPVAELKRINNIHKDNEIFARKIIKVPSNPLSILLEKDYFAERSDKAKSDKTAQEQQLQKEENCDVIIETINNSQVVYNNVRNKSEMDEDEKFSFTPVPPEENLESATLLATTVVDHKGNDVMSCSGADWGISWHALLLVTLLLGLGGPFFYVFWLIWSKREKPEGS